MISRENIRLRIEVTRDGLDVAIRDKVRDCDWVLKPETRRVASRRSGENESGTPLPPGTISASETESIESTHDVEGGRIVFRWTLEADHVALSLECIGSEIDVARLAWPGRFSNSLGEPGEALVPQYQGALLRHTAETWEDSAGRGGHAAMSMGMAAWMTSRAALLVTPDELVDWRLTYGSDAGGPYAFFNALPCAVDGRRPMTVRLCPCGPSVTAVAKRYRRWAQLRGQWTPWEEKIAAKPMLENLFGAVMTFIGYVHDDKTDYVAAASAMRAMGFESMFLYPARFASYSQEFTMAGGRRPIWLDDSTLARLADVPGAHVAPWAWTIEAIDDGSESVRAIYRHGRDGGLSGGWAMDGQRWQHVCTPYQTEFIQRRLADDMSAMDWLHFDVNASFMPQPCFRRDLNPDNDNNTRRQIIGAVNNGIGTITPGEYEIITYDFAGATPTPTPGAGTTWQVS